MGCPTLTTCPTLQSYALMTPSFSADKRGVAELSGLFGMRGLHGVHACAGGIGSSLFLVEHGGGHKAFLAQVAVAHQFCFGKGKRAACLGYTCRAGLGGKLIISRFEFRQYLSTMYRIA